MFSERNNKRINKLIVQQTKLLAKQKKKKLASIKGIKYNTINQVANHTRQLTALAYKRSNVSACTTSGFS